jgi:hypothetical protein
MEVISSIFVVLWRNTSHARQTSAAKCDLTYYVFQSRTLCFCRSQWPRGPKCKSAAARLLRVWVPILPGTSMFFCFECCVLLDRSICDELITCPGGVLLTVVRRCVDTSRMRPWPIVDCHAKKQTLCFCLIISTAESLLGVLVCARNLICTAFHTFGYQAYAG